MANPIVHVEIPATDPSAAAQFYADIFGWSITKDDQFNYHMFKAEGGPGGGFTTVGQYGTKVDDVLVYLGTDDINGTLARIEAAGGKTLSPKMEIPGTGWFATFSDPTGNTMALYTPMQAMS